MTAGDYVALSELSRTLSGTSEITRRECCPTSAPGSAHAVTGAAGFANQTDDGPVYAHRLALRPSMTFQRGDHGQRRYLSRVSCARETRCRPASCCHGSGWLPLTEST